MAVDDVELDIELFVRLAVELDVAVLVVETDAEVVELIAAPLATAQLVTSHSPLTSSQQQMLPIDEAEYALHDGVYHAPW